MKTALLIAADSVRALLHHRVLLALMVATLGLTIIASVGLSGMRKNITAMYGQDSDQLLTSTTEKTSDADKEKMREAQKRAGMENMSEADKRKMREAMESAGSMVQALFYGATSFAGTIIALFIFCTAISSEIRKGTIRVTLAKPVSRTQFLLGKYFGGVVVMLGYWAIASIAIILFTQSQQTELAPAFRFAPWLMLCKQLMLGSVGMLLSLWMHPLVAAALAYFASANLLSPPNPLYFVLPSYDRFGAFGEILAGTLISLKDVCLLSLYAVDFTVIVLLLTLWRFRTKELIY